jgi:hypothetical protein
MLGSSFTTLPNGLTLVHLSANTKTKERVERKGEMINPPSILMMMKQVVVWGGGRIGPVWKEAFEGGHEAQGIHYRLTIISEGYGIRQRDLKWKQKGDPRVEKDGRFKGSRDVLQKKQRHNVSATTEKFPLRPSLSLPPSWMQLQVRMKLISSCCLEETRVMMDDLSLMGDTTRGMVCEEEESNHVQRRLIRVLSCPFGVCTMPNVGNLNYLCC